MTEGEEADDGRPFYWFLLLFLAIIYVSVLSTDAGMMDPIQVAAFTTLMVLHGALHWTAPRLLRQRWFLPYFVVQGAIVSALTVMVHNQGIVLGLYMGMMGEAAGMLERPRLIMVAVSGYVVLMFLSAWLTWGEAILPSMLAFAVPMVIFVVLYVLLFLREANARKEAQSLLRELEGAHARLAEYSREVEALTLAGERQRMARELHDTLAQGLAGLILQLEALEAQLGRGNVEKAALIAGQAKERARGTLVEARRTIDDLRTLPDLSLVDSLRQEVDRFSAATGIATSLELSPGLSLDSLAAESVLRCVSEGLSNIGRHAHASRVRVVVAMEMEGEGVRVEVDDNGIGFDAAAATQPGHYGLLGLRERARLAGGTLVVKSGPGEGTTLRLLLPLVPQQKAPAVPPPQAFRP